MAKRYKIEDGLAFRELEGQIFAITPNDGRFHIVTDESGPDETTVGPYIVALLEEPRTIDELVESVCQEFEVPASQALNDVKRFVDDLVREGLVVFAGGSAE